eukprot:CAMPEP_0184693964 /NCGR_PEP_ID=MMETSP0313-20130426/2051_1 /TAXON_ID=2792 /ORGANISM="Porphyridium aerugineum, Strain SAG 1380-2" /LENGTH=871 /DNA_ID=CAMNT_0027152159 /DNA_START=191 /DNA_END=2807 /DNA_ORIENTATION=+
MVKKKTTVAPSKPASAATASVPNPGVASANVNATKATNSSSPVISYTSTTPAGEHNANSNANASSKAHQMHQNKQQLQQQQQQHMQQHIMHQHHEYHPHDMPDPCDLFNSYKTGETCATEQHAVADEPTCNHDHSHGHSHNHNHNHHPRPHSNQHGNYDEISVQLATASVRESFAGVPMVKKPSETTAATATVAAGNKSHAAPKPKVASTPAASGPAPAALSRKISMSPPDLTNSSPIGAKKPGLNFDEDQLSRFEQMFFDLLTRPSSKEAVGAGAGSGASYRTSNSFVPRKQQQHRKISREMASMRKKGNDNPGCICAQCHSNRVTGGARFARAAAAAAAASGNTNAINGPPSNTNRNSRNNSKLKNNPPSLAPPSSSNGPKYRPPPDEDTLDYYDEDYYSDDAYFDEEILTDDEDGMDPDSASYSVEDDDEMGPPVSDFEMVCFAMMGKVDVEDVLIELRCNSDVGFGNTPLHLAAVFGNLDAAKLIVEKYGGKHLIWEKNWNGETPVFLARDFRNEQVFKYLSDISDAGVDAYIMELDQEEERERKAKEKKKLKKQRQKLKKKGKKGDGEGEADGDGDNDGDDDETENKSAESALKANGASAQTPVDIKEVAGATSSAPESAPTGTKNKASNDNNPLTDISNGSNKKSKKSKAKAKLTSGSLPGNGIAEQPATAPVKTVTVQRGTPGLKVEHPPPTNDANNRSSPSNRTSSTGTSIAPPIDLPTVALPPQMTEQSLQIPSNPVVVKAGNDQASLTVTASVPTPPAAAAAGSSKPQQQPVRREVRSEQPIVSSSPVDLFPVLDKLSDEDDDDMPSFEEMLRELKASKIDFSDAYSRKELNHLPKSEMVTDPPLPEANVFGLKGLTPKQA